MNNDNTESQPNERGRVAAVGEIWRNIHSNREFTIAQLEVIDRREVPVYAFTLDDGTRLGEGALILHFVKVTPQKDETP